jgi:hypothetical protein
MIDVEPNPNIKCASIRKILGFVPQTKMVYLSHENGSVTWCMFDVTSRVPLFRVGDTLPELEEAEIVAYVITEGVRWIDGYLEFDSKKGWSDIAEMVLLAYQQAMKESF